MSFAGDAISGIGGILGARKTAKMMAKYLQQAADRLGKTVTEYGEMVANFQAQAMPHNKLGATAAREATKLIEGGPEAAQARYMMHPKHQAAVESQMAGLAATGAGSRSGAGDRAQAALAEVEAGAPYKLAGELTQMAGGAAEAGARYGQLGLFAQEGRAEGRQDVTDKLLARGQWKAESAGATIAGIGNLLGGGVDAVGEAAAAAATGGASMAMSGSSPSFDSSKGWGQGAGNRGMAAQQGGGGYGLSPYQGGSGLTLGQDFRGSYGSGQSLMPDYNGQTAAYGTDPWGNPISSLYRN